MKPTHTTEWSKPGDFYGGFTQYRIEFARTDHGWYQRHIWRNNRGDVETEAWIVSFPEVPSNAKEIASHTVPTQKVTK